MLFRIDYLELKLSLSLACAPLSLGSLALHGKDFKQDYTTLNAKEQTYFGWH